jgi:hypothetical protein
MALYLFTRVVRPVNVGCDKPLLRRKVIQFIVTLFSQTETKEQNL